MPQPLCMSHSPPILAGIRIGMGYRGWRALLNRMRAANNLCYGEESPLRYENLGAKEMSRFPFASLAPGLSHSTRYIPASHRGEGKRLTMPPMAQADPAETVSGFRPTSRLARNA